MSVGLIVPSFALAGQTQVNVRIEGKSETLFEGPIWSEGHNIQASSDIRERPCDATNNHAHATPGPTPTASAVEAMRIVGETFDGQWYPGYDDYFITRWGSDEEDPSEGAYWGILVNDVFTDVGGCQYELHEDDEVLWVYDAFEEKAKLALFPADDSASRPPLTAIAKLGQSFEVQVEAYGDSAEEDPPGEPDRADATPYSGARVAPVLTSPKGFERVKTASPEDITTNSEGKASITFTTSGWHRIKAGVPIDGKGEEEVVRSNRIDVCVPAHGETGCGPVPAEDDPRTPPAWAGTPEEEHHETPAETLGGADRSGGQASGGSQPGSGPGAAPSSSTQTPAPLRSVTAAFLTLESITTKRLLLKLSAPGTVTVRIARLRGNGHHHHLQSVKAITVKTSRAGALKVKLPRLVVGSYQVSIDLAGAKTLVEALRVPRT
ncbi:MAG TPA: DUF4430 domain-containing protein [Solirubrobacteraceae bacterium]|nr:DUF4430 domain-containing protein [Solirubrobacteraceae bacterium]